MIIGYFGRTGRLYVSGHLQFPRLGVSGTLEFLVDTGADRTIIHPPDIRELALPVDLLAGRTATYGVGGPAGLFVEPAILRFTDADRSTVYAYRLDIGIAEPRSANRNFPSLLGRNILDCWYLESDPTYNMLQFTVRRTL